MQASKAYWNILMGFHSCFLFFVKALLVYSGCQEEPVLVLSPKKLCFFSSLITKRRKSILWYSFMQLYSSIYNGKDNFS